MLIGCFQHTSTGRIQDAADLLACVQGRDAHGTDLCAPHRRGHQRTPAALRPITSSMHPPRSTTNLLYTFSLSCVLPRSHFYPSFDILPSLPQLLTPSSGSERRLGWYIHPFCILDPSFLRLISILYSWIATCRFGTKVRVRIRNMSAEALPPSLQTCCQRVLQQ